MWPRQASPSLQRLEAAEIILGSGYRTGSRADTCLLFLGDTHDRGPTVSRCHGLSTCFKAGAHDLYNASSTHSPPETTPMRTPSIRRIGHTQKSIGGAVPGRSRDQGVAGTGLLCYMSYGPFPSQFRWVTLLHMHLPWLPMAQASTNLDMVFSPVQPRDSGYPCHPIFALCHCAR